MLLGVPPGHLQDRWTPTTELCSNRSGSQASHTRPCPACRRALCGHFVFLIIAVHWQHKQINEAFHIKSRFPAPLEVRCVFVGPHLHLARIGQTEREKRSQRDQAAQLGDYPRFFFKDSWRQNSRVVWSSAPQWERWTNRQPSSCPHPFSGLSNKQEKGRMAVRVINNQARNALSSGLCIWLIITIRAAITITNIY